MGEVQTVASTGKSIELFSLLSLEQMTDSDDLYDSGTFHYYIYFKTKIDTNFYLQKIRQNADISDFLLWENAIKGGNISIHNFYFSTLLTKLLEYRKLNELKLKHLLLNYFLYFVI